MPKPKRVRRSPAVYIRLLGVQRQLVLMSVPFVVWVVIFAYLPLAGWVMAFQQFKPGRSLLQQTWVGLENFLGFFRDPKFYEVLRNTLVMSSLYVFFSFVAAVSLALLLNEVRFRPYKRFIQTVSYLPHFVSWVVVASLFYTVLSTDGGMVNRLLMSLGIVREGVPWLSEGRLFWPVVTVAQVWKTSGWSAIIYLAAISSIDPELYEAASVDGLGRLGKMIHITLPGISNTMVILLVLSVGGLMLASGFDPSFLLGNNLTVAWSDNLAIYAYRYGIGMSRYSLSAAISVFNSVVSLILLLSANRIASRMRGESVL